MIVLAAAICASACFTAFAFHGRSLRVTDPIYRFSWLGLTGLVAGAGVWTTHFAAMLAYMPKLSIGFEPWATSGSLVIAVIGMTAAFSAPVLSPGRGVRPLAGFLAGLTIAAMHFTGISALRTEGVIQWNLGYVVASVAIGGTLASAAMTSFGRLRERAAWVTASLLMIVAIVGLHFTAMTALTLVYVPAEMPVAIVSRTALAFAVTGVMALILVAIAALVWMENFGRRSAFKGVHGALNSVSAGLAFFDSLGRLVSWNDAFASMIGSSAIVLKPGVSRQQLIDASHEAGWSAVGEEALSQHWQNRGRGAAMPASVVKLPDGRFLRQEFFSGGDGGGVTVMTDITAEETFGRMMTEARDAAEAASRAKSRFLANLSHEIRTPLNGILGLTDILAASDLPAGQLETVRIIQSSGGLLNALLSDLLDLAQAEAGVTELRPEPQNLPDLLRSVTDLHATSAATKGLRLEVVAEGVDRLVACDGMRLGQVLGNLVSNAVKFSEAGGATVSARRDGERVTFAVTDTGVGIDAAFHERLFEGFQQLDDSETRRHGGAGLGLAICHEYVALMGGQLTCLSEAGAGSTFAFTLDLPPLARRRRVAAPRARARSGRLQVLVVDDNAVNRQVLDMILDAAGMDHHDVADGAQAVEAVQGKAFDAILMDIQMPVMDGLEATRRIRAMQRAGRKARIPIIIVSANGLQEHVDAGMAAGADGYLTKPVTANQVLGALASYARTRPPALAAGVR